jgi:hypothetical protein
VYISLKSLRDLVYQAREHNSVHNHLVSEKAF